MARVLVIRFSSLGDLVLTFPSIEYLAAEKAEVHVLTKESFAPLLAMHGHSAQIHTISDHASLRELLAKIKELKSLRFDRVYDLHRNLRSTLVGVLLARPFFRISKNRVKEFILYILKRTGFSILRQNPMNRAADALQVVSRSDKPLSVVPAAHPQNIAPLSGATEAWRQGFRNGYVCLAAESAWKEKEWPSGRFLEVALFLAKRGIGIVWVGLRPLAEAAKFPGALDLTRKLGISEVAGVLASAKMLICNDSGLMHLAEAVGTPVVAVFGPTTKELGFGPRLPMSKIIEEDLWCRPCSKTGRWCIRPVQRWKCLTDVSAKNVIDAALGILEQRNQKIEGQRENLDL
jgi:ADP-heptose:LPS heptosyltransferase